MKKKVFFKHRNLEIAEWDGNLVEIFSRLEKISVKTQGMKNEMMKFLGSSKIWRQP